VAYNDRDDPRNVINHEQSQKSMLTEYFRTNNVDPFANSFLYREFLEYGIERRKNDFKGSKECRLAGWCMCAVQKEKGITSESF
jgi:hypothetical protein